jgi:aspartyl-tRNA(Asn)/glutamyl-tRNA(Gln) amidotransferase subunit A
MLSRATRAPRRCHYIRPLASVRTHTRHAVHDLQAIRTRNEDCNAFVHLVSELPRQQSGPLAQHTVGVKDNICTSDMPTTCSSSMLEGKLKKQL